MKPRDTISVMVPAYNACSTIEACIKSIQEQDVPELEIIVVDDGSTDGTAELVSKIAMADSRVHLVQQANGGVGRARNTGLAYMQGDWFCFVDADDALLPGALKTLYEKAKAVDADFVCASYELVKADDGRRRLMALPARDSMSREEAHRFFLTTALNYSQPWGKLYRRELFEGVHYPVDRLYEDISVMPQLLERAHSICIMDTPVYSYRQTTESISQTEDVAMQTGGFTARLENYYFYCEEYPELAPLAADAAVYFGYYLLGKISRSGYASNAETYRNTVKMIRMINPVSTHAGISRKVADVLFFFSPKGCGRMCQLFSYLKNGL